MFDPNPDKLEFYVKIGAQEFRGTDSNEVQRKARDYLDKTLKMEWIPVIEIMRVGSSYERSFCHGERMRHSFGYQADRFYIARKENGEGVRLQWENFGDKTEAERLMQSTWYRWETVPNIQPETNSREWKTLVHYDEDMWTGLTELWEAFTKLEARVVDMFTSDKGHQKIRLVALAKQLQLTEGGGE